MVVRLKEAIRASGRTLHDLAGASGVSAAQLSRFLNGKRDLTFGSAAKVMEALGLELAVKQLPKPPRGRKRKES